jgi:hypothetical protein
MYSEVNTPFTIDATGISLDRAPSGLVEPPAVDSCRNFFKSRSNNNTNQRTIRRTALGHSPWGPHVRFGRVQTFGPGGAVRWQAAQFCFSATLAMPPDLVHPVSLGNEVDAGSAAERAQVSDCARCTGCSVTVGGRCPRPPSGRSGWVASIKHNSKNIYIGTFTAIEPAYIAYRLKSSLCGGGFQMADTDLAH